MSKGNGRILMEQQNRQMTMTEGTSCKMKGNDERILK
jgi:hypothetical protein